MQSPALKSRLRLVLSCVVFLTAGAAPAFEELDNGTAIEGCVGCHAIGTVVPVANVNDPRDAHYIDLDPDGPQTESGYRQLRVTPMFVDVSGSSVVIDFVLTDENDAPIDNVFDSDGRLTIAKLQAAELGDPSEWQAWVRGERFTSAGALFESFGGGAYRYTSAFDPTSVPVVQGDTLRAALQISAGDLPAGNGWCDFDADLAAPSSCSGPVSVTRDIVQTATCNGCHGFTSDTELSFHGGGRTQVEYCVTCHNPGIGETDMTNLVHKIHYGAELTDGFRRWSNVHFTRDTDNCTACHMRGGVDEENWKTEPNRTACGSCHDDVNFDTGENHGSGGQQPTNRFCRNCHPPIGEANAFVLPVATVHQGVARASEASFYRGDGNGFALSATHDRATDLLTIDYSVTRDGVPMVLQSDDRWMNGARLAIQLAWRTEEYTNEGSDSSPAPAQPVSLNALDVGGAIVDLGNGSYRAVVDVPSGGSRTLGIVLEGHPAADLMGQGDYTSIPVRDAVDFANVDSRGNAQPRRAVVDIAKCNACHDGSGAGLTLHGNNRSGEMQACVTCHNPDATDIRQRPADPSMAIDGKREQSVDMKRMIHSIHAGAELEEGLVIYGFGGRPHDYSEVEFVGNNANCLTCHIPGTYSTDRAWATLPTTIDTGDDVTDPADDLNISPIASACSSCHDSEPAKRHMVLNGASFMAIDAHIFGVPEPGSDALALAALGTLAALARRRTHRRDSRRD